MDISVVHNLSFALIRKCFGYQCMRIFFLTCLSRLVVLTYELVCRRHLALYTPFELNSSKVKMLLNQWKSKLTLWFLLQ